MKDYAASVTVAFAVIGVLWLAKNNIPQSVGNWIRS